MKSVKTRVQTVTCGNCGAEIYSRARHDYRSCPCSRTQVDGGFDYLKYGWHPEDSKPTIKTRYVGMTRKELYDDWNTMQDKFGVLAKKGA